MPRRRVRTEWERWASRALAYQSTGWMEVASIPDGHDVTFCRQPSRPLVLGPLAWVIRLVSPARIECRRVWLDADGRYHELRVDEPS